MTNNIEVLRGLVAKFIARKRREADEADEQRWGLGRFDNDQKEALLSEAKAARADADELDAAMAAQPCTCGLATCQEPWEPGCGLGNSEEHAVAAPQQADAQDCETCNGVGWIDERLGGYSFSNPKAPCPDCDGTGEYVPAPQQPEAQAGGEVDVTGFGTPPLMHDERADAEKVYSLTAFDYAAAPIGSRDWTIYWRGWWHRSLVYGDTTPPPSAVPEVQKVIDGMLRLAPTCESDWESQLHEWAAMLTAAPGPKEGA